VRQRAPRAEREDDGRRILYPVAKSGSKRIQGCGTCGAPFICLTSSDTGFAYCTRSVCDWSKSKEAFRYEERGRSSGITVSDPLPVLIPSWARSDHVHEPSPIRASRYMAAAQAARGRILPPESLNELRREEAAELPSAPGPSWAVPPVPAPVRRMCTTPKSGWQPQLRSPSTKAVGVPPAPQQLKTDRKSP